MILDLPTDYFHKLHPSFHNSNQLCLHKLHIDNILDIYCRYEKRGGQIIAISTGKPPKVGFASSQLSWC